MMQSNQRQNQNNAKRHHLSTHTPTAGRPLHAQDFTWEFGWSFDGFDWMGKNEAQPSREITLLDKALALAG